MKRFFVFMFLITAIYQGSSQSVQLVFPNGQSGVSLQPTIELFSLTELDTNRLSKDPLIMFDSIYVEVVSGDSVLSNAIGYFLPSGDNTMDSLGKLNESISLNGVPAIFSNDMTGFTLFATPFRPLEYNTNYDLVIIGLREKDYFMFNPIDTVINNVFTTLEPVYELKSLSLNGDNSVKCNSDIYIDLNKSTTTAQINGQNILELFKLDSIGNYDSNTVRNYYSQVNCTNTLSENSTRVHLNSSSLESGEHYRLNINIGLLTGDTLDNFDYAFNVANMSKLTFAMKHKDSSITLIDSTGSYFLNGEDKYISNGYSIDIYAPLYMNGYQFRYWECETSDSINGIKDNFITYEATCGDIGDHIIEAVYSDITIDTLTIQATANGRFEVIGYLDSLGNGRYTIEKVPDTEISIIAVPDSGYIFEGYQYDSTKYLIANPEEYLLRLKMEQANYGFLLAGQPGRSLFDEGGVNINLGGGFIWGPTVCNTKQICFHFRPDGSFNPDNMIYNFMQNMELKVNNAPYEITNISYGKGEICVDVTGLDEFEIELTNNNDNYNFDNINYMLPNRNQMRYEYENGDFPDKTFTFGGGNPVKFVADTENDGHCVMNIYVNVQRKSYVLEFLIGLTTNDYVPYGLSNSRIGLFRSPKQEYDPINNVHIARYTVYSGETVRVAAVNISAANYQHHGWVPPSPSDNNLISSPVYSQGKLPGSDVDYNDVLEIQISDANAFGPDSRYDSKYFRCRYNFKSDFMLKSILYTLSRGLDDNGAPIGETNTKVEVLLGDIISGNKFQMYSTKVGMDDIIWNLYYERLQGVSQRTTTVSFVFTNFLDENTIGLGTIEGKDLNGRPDGNNDVQYNVKIDDNCFVYNNRIDFKLINRDVESGLCVSHSQDFEVTINLDQIKNVDGESLDLTGIGNTFKVGLRTENPGMKVRNGKALLRVYANCQLCSGGISLYGHAWAAIGENYKKGATTTLLAQVKAEKGDQVPNENGYQYFSIYSGMNELFLKNAQEDLIFWPKLKDSDVLSLGMELTEKRGKTAYDKLTIIAAGILQYLITNKTDTWNIGSQLTKIINEENKGNGWNDLFDTLGLWTRDKNIAQYSTNTTIANKWIANKWNVPQYYMPHIITLNQNGAFFEFEVTLYGM